MMMKTMKQQLRNLMEDCIPAMKKKKGNGKALQSNRNWRGNVLLLLKLNLLRRRLKKKLRRSLPHLSVALVVMRKMPVQKALRKKLTLRERKRVKLQAQLTQSVRVRKNFILHQLVKQRRYLCSQLLAVKRQIPQKLLTYHRVYQEVMISLWTCQLKKKVILNVLSQPKNTNPSRLALVMLRACRLRIWLPRTLETLLLALKVEVKSGEEDEEILFKERAKLYRWDRDATQWKERGVGELKILFHTQKKYYRILMRRDQVLKVCANHVITKEMNLVPSDTSKNVLIWTATDYAGEFIIGRVIKAMNNSWHPECFCCDICQQVLADIGFVKNAGRHLCRPCHNREKARGLGKYICQKCHAIIDEQPLIFKNDPYHPDHFNCANCGKELTADARELKGELYCLPCHDKMGVPICGACRRPIEGRVVNAMGKQWHVEHFVCAKCEKPFLGHRHYERKGLAYCETHYNQLFGDVCFHCNRVIEGDVVSALNKAWCVNCFACSTCNTKLTLKNKFVEFDMKPVCKKCYEKFPLELKKRLKKLAETVGRK
ncbi:uncharacterized protein LOC125688938 isoform X40 [Lagopus muta]|uniref:uncharacterized protein LOC125688938 isoform X40 n=1 Tax=Lagopus muta TaxID=64668 RepID=UPI00209CC6DA|nr:uncharacterized protein LOC125688938 isoform X40 [Lagopus muta]